MKRAAAILFVTLLSAVVSAEMARPLTDLNLRSAPTSRRSNVITVLGTEDHFEILETRRGWYRVRLVKTGAEGWVAKKYVTSTPTQPEQTPSDVVDRGSDGRGLATGGNVAILAGLLALVGYLTGYKSIAGASSASHKVPNRPVALVLSLTLGALYVTLTLPKLLMSIGAALGWETLGRIGAWSLAFNQRLADSLPAFSALLLCIFWVTLFYLISLAILAVRHGDLQLLGSGAAVLACSIPLFYLLCWTGYVVVKIIVAIWWVFAMIARGVAWVLGGIFTFLAHLVVSFAMWMHGWLYQLLGQFWWLVPACIAIALAVVILNVRRNWGAILKVAAQFLLGCAVVGVVVYVLRWFWDLIAPFVLPVLKFIGTVLAFLAGLLGRLLLGLGVLLALATIGQLLLDQVQSALSAGRRRRGVIIGALAIGASIAILLLVSNPVDVNTGLPAFAAAIAAEYLHQPAAIVDALIAFTLVSISIAGIWRNMPALGEEPTMREFNKSLVYGAMGVVVAGGLAALGGGAGNE